MCCSPPLTLRSPSSSWFYPFVCFFFFFSRREETGMKSLHSHSTAVSFRDFPRAFTDLQNDHISAFQTHPLLMAQDIIGLLLTMREYVEKECEFGQSCWDILSSEWSDRININHDCHREATICGVCIELCDATLRLSILGCATISKSVKQTPETDWPPLICSPVNRRKKRGSVKDDDATHKSWNLESLLSYYLN